MIVYTLIEVYYDGSHTFHNLIDIFKDKDAAIDEAIKLLTDYYDKPSGECVIEHIWRGTQTIIYFESEATSYRVESRKIK